MIKSLQFGEHMRLVHIEFYDGVTAKDAIETLKLFDIHFKASEVVKAETALTTQDDFAEERPPMISSPLTTQV